MGVMTAQAVAAPLTGAGSTLVAPLMNQWILHSGLGITYSAVGSGSWDHGHLDEDRQLRGIGCPADRGAGTGRHLRVSRPRGR